MCSVFLRVCPDIFKPGIDSFVNEVRKQVFTACSESKNVPLILFSISDFFCFVSFVSSLYCSMRSSISSSSGSSSRCKERMTSEQEISSHLLAMKVIAVAS